MNLLYTVVERYLQINSYQKMMNIKRFLDESDSFQELNVKVIRIENCSELQILERWWSESPVAISIDRTFLWNESMSVKDLRETLYLESIDA